MGFIADEPLVKFVEEPSARDRCLNKFGNGENFQGFACGGPVSIKTPLVGEHGPTIIVPIPIMWGRPSFAAAPTDDILIASGLDIQ